MEDTLAIALRRADSYKFLSECYYLPDAELIQKVAVAAEIDPSFAEPALHAPSDSEIDALTLDFTSLFIGPYKLLAPPYGSVYLEDNRIMGESTLDIRNLYESEGLDVIIKDAPDHIAMELEFVYFLISKQIAAIRDNDLQTLQSYLLKQSSFLNVHLGRWLPQLAENVQKHAQTDFYRNLASVTDKHVRSDIAILARHANLDSQTQ